MQAPTTNAKKAARIVIDVLDDGRLKVNSTRDGGRFDAAYAPADRTTALQRVLPQAIDEAVEYVQGRVGSSVTE